MAILNQIGFELLLEPFFSQSFGYFLNIDGFPSIFTILGVSIVLIALYTYNQIKIEESKIEDPHGYKTEQNVEILKERIGELQGQIRTLKTFNVRKS